MLTSTYMLLMSKRCFVEKNLILDQKRWSRYWFTSRKDVSYRLMAYSVRVVSEIADGRYSRRKEGPTLAETRPPSLYEKTPEYNIWTTFYYIPYSRTRIALATKNFLIATAILLIAFSTPEAIY